MRRLNSVRNDINAVDARLVHLLEKRVSLAREVADIKNRQNSADLTDLVREKEIIDELITKTQDPILRDTLPNLWEVLFKMSKIARILTHVKDCPFREVGIIGDGLIGRSLYNLIQAKAPTCTLHIHNHEWSVNDFTSCELIIIATPISTVSDIAEKLAIGAHVLTNGVVVMDVASVKKEIAHTFALLQKQVGGRMWFVPTHPMGGSQKQGKESANMTLFAGRPWIISYAKGHGHEKAIHDRVSQFVSFCGSVPIEIEAEHHDGLVVYVSHIPGILSKLISDFVSEKSPDSLALAGSGFKLMTRIGKTENVRMRKQIGLHNSKEIQRAFFRLYAYLRKTNPTEWKE